MIEEPIMIGTRVILSRIHDVDHGIHGEVIGLLGDTEFISVKWDKYPKSLHTECLADLRPANDECEIPL